MDYVKWELKLFYYNRKNIIIFVILSIASLYYALYLAPAYQPIETVNKKEIEARYEDRKEFLEHANLGPGAHYYTLFAYQIYQEWNEIEGNRLAALNHWDLQAYAQATHEWYLYAAEMIRTDPYDVLRYHPSYYTYGNKYPKQDGHYNYLYSAERYGEYATADYNLNLNIFEERTAFQTLKRMMESYLPYILLISCLLLSNDIVTKDRKHPSIVNGFPMTPFKRIMLKGVVAFIGSLTTIAVLLPAFIIIGFREGFGTITLPAVVYEFEILNNGTFGNISMGMFLLQCFGMILLFFILFIGLILLLSIIFKNEYVNLVIGSICFLEMFYYERGNLIDDWLSYLPSSYVQIADVISGYKNYVLLTGSITAKTGFIALLSTVTLVILFIWLVAKRKDMTIY